MEKFNKMFWNFYESVGKVNFVSGVILIFFMVAFFMVVYFAYCTNLHKSIFILLSHKDLQRYNGVDVQMLRTKIVITPITFGINKKIYMSYGYKSKVTLNALEFALLHEKYHKLHGCSETEADKYAANIIGTKKFKRALSELHTKRLLSNYNIVHYCTHGSTQHRIDAILKPSVKRRVFHKGGKSFF